MISGWGVSVFSYPTFWWWLVPILATHLGAVLGAWTYYLAIELHWTKQDDLDLENEDFEAEPLPVKRDFETNGGQRGYFHQQNGSGSSAPPATSGKVSL